MEGFLGVLNWVMANYPIVISALVGILGGVIAISMLIPGEQPEKFLKSVVDFLAKFSAKPKE